MRAWFDCRLVLITIILFSWLIHTWIITLSTLSSSSTGADGINQKQKYHPESAPGQGQFALATQQSFGFFNDINENDWRRLQQIFMDHENHRYPDMPFTYHPSAKPHQARPEIYKHRKWSSIPAWYQTNYEPNFSCQFEKRVGMPMNGDGPKWVCDPHRIKKLAEIRKAKDPQHPGCVVYSVGSNGDFTFELGLQKEVGEGVCEFHIFDMGDYKEHRPKELNKGRVHYHRWGLKKQGAAAPAHWNKKAGEINKFLGLKDTIRELGHEHLGVVDIFKIDCEKCEWDTYQDWLADDLPMLHQILVEVHGAPIDKALGFFDSIEAAGYLRFHKEPNIMWDPTCIEYAFVKVDKSFMKGKELGNVRINNG